MLRRHGERGFLVATWDEALERVAEELAIVDPARAAFYLTSRGISEEDATALIVNGFFEPFVKELPMEYAVELNRLLALSMEGSVG